MVGKAVNDLKREFIRWALIIALGVTAACAVSALGADAPLERLTDAVRRYAASPLALDHPPPRLKKYRPPSRRAR